MGGMRFQFGGVFREGLGKCPLRARGVIKIQYELIIGEGGALWRKVRFTNERRQCH